MTISRNNTQKKDIINNIFNELGLPKNYTAKLVDDLITTLISNIVNQNIFKVKNFGTFTLKRKTKRMGRNPKNQINHEILERNVVAFKVAAELNRRVNNYVEK